jgi:hypothetical protein
MPLLIKSLDPFDPESRTVERIPKNRRIAALCPKTNLPVVCIYNGTPLLRAGWKRRVKHGDTVAFVVLPRGKAFKSVLSIVVMAVVSFYVSPIVAQKFGFVAGSFGAAMVTAGLSIVTSLLLNAILPPPKPPTPQSMADIAAPSPTYNLAAQGNAARLEQPIPVHYGRHIAYPDFAARPYQEYQDNEQYLYQLLVVGQGLYDIESIRIEDTPIATFEGAQTEIVQPGQTVTLFPSAVIQSSEIGGAEITGPQGPFTASGPDESATAIGVDLVCPAGLYYSNDAGGLDAKSLTVRVEAQNINNEGAAVGAWIVLGTETINGATNTAIRRSYRYAVAAGRYQVRVTRTDTKDTRARAAHAVHWAGLRAYLPDATDYGNITLLAVKLKATAQISEQATRRINVVGTRKLPTWHPTNGWSSPVATRSIAWALADICRASYGASLSDDRYDLAGLYALDQVWTARGDTFDARFDGKMTIGEALSNTARAGRAKWYQQAGKVGFWRDTPQTVPRYIFQPRNIVAGSFSMDFAPASTDTSDAVRMSYFDERYWQQRDATCMLAGSAGAKLAEINAFGMINRAQVVREGMYIAAANRYRRRFVKFETEMEGHLVRFGDLIGIAHDVPAWGQSGDLIGWDAATRTATLSEPPVWTDGANHYVRLVGHNGTPTGIIQAAKHATQPNRIILAVDPGFTPETEGYRRERTRYVFGSAGQIEAQALVVAIRPKDRTRIEIEAVVEDSRVHDAETGTVPDDTAPGYPSQPTAPVVSGLIVSEAGTPTAPQQIVSWQPAEGATHYLVEYTTDDINWIKAGDTTGSRWTIDGIAPGQYFNARVAAMGLLRGPWVYKSGISGASVAAPGGIVDLALAAPFAGPECSIRWSAVPRASRYRVRVYAAGQLRRETSITGTRYTYTVADAAQDGGPWRSLEFRVLPLGIVAGDTEATISATNPNVGQLNNVQVAGTPLGIQWSADAPSDPDLSRYLVWASTTPGFTASSSNLVYAGVGNVAIIKLAPNQRYYIRCAAHDVWGTDGLNISGELQAETGTIDFADVAGQIESPQLADSLLAPINAVPGIASAIDWDAETAKINRLGAVALVKSERVHTFASITVEQTERSSATDALAQQITTLQAQVVSGDSTNSAAIQAEQTARANADTALGQQITTVQAIAERSRTYRQTTAPTSGMAAGDLWFDSDDNNKPYRYTGSAWVATDDTRIAANAAAIQTEQTARANADTALGQQITTLQAQVVSGDSTNSAAIQAEQTARANADTALGQQITTVQAIAERSRTYRQTTAPTSGMAAGDLWFDSDDNNKPYRYTGSAWVATDDTRIAANAAAIQTEQTARANADTALGQQITTLQAQVASGDSTNSAAIQAEQTARASGDAANAASINNVQARLDTGDFAAVKTSAAATASAVGSIQAKWSVQTQALADGKKAVAGIEVIADGGAQESAIRLLADKFIVYKPDGTGAKQVFTLGTVNGQTTLILLGDLLADGTIAARHLSAESVTADKLSVNDLSAISANLGNITAGRVRSSDNAVDLDLNNKYLRVLDNAGSERVKLGLLEAGKYGLRVRDPATNKTAALTPNVGIVVASGTVTMPTALNADGTYEVAVALGASYQYSDLTVIVDSDDVPAFNVNGVWSSLTVSGSTITELHATMSGSATYRERDGDNASGRPKYKAHTVSNTASTHNVIVSTYVLTRWNKGGATSGSTIYLQGSKTLQVYDRTANAVKNLIEIGWPITINYTVIARNYQG